jgi:hypothetical protein
MRRNLTFDVAGIRVRARDQDECTAKLAAWRRGVHRELLNADLIVRLPLQNVINSQESVDRLLYNYFGALGFEPEESRIEAENEGQFKKYAGLNGIDVGTITVGDSVYLAARPLRDPVDRPSEKAMVWLDRVMTTAKHAANHVFEQSALKADSDLRAVLAYRDRDGDLRIEERGWASVLKQQSGMAGVHYRVMQRDQFAQWLKTMDDDYAVTDKAWATGEMLIKKEADEIAMIFERGSYRLMDADAIGTPSQAEFVGNVWREKHQGFTLVGAHEMVEAQERLPEWLTETEREQVMQRVNQSLRMLFYGSSLHPGLSELTERFTHIKDTDVYQTFFREVNEGNIRFQRNKKNGRVEVDTQDAVKRLEEVFKTALAELPTTASRSDDQHQRNGIRV